MTLSISFTTMSQTPEVSLHTSHAPTPIIQTKTLNASSHYVSVNFPDLGEFTFFTREIEQAEAIAGGFRTAFAPRQPIHFVPAAVGARLHDLLKEARKSSAVVDVYGGKNDLIRRLADALEAALSDSPAAEPHPLAAFPDGIKPGLYIVHWKSGGSSEAAIGMLPNGNRWIAPTNWTHPGIWPDAGAWHDIERAEPVVPAVAGQGEALTEADAPHTGQDEMALNRKCECCGVSEEYEMLAYSGSKLTCQECDDRLEREWFAEDPDNRKHSLDTFSPLAIEPSGAEDIATGALPPEDHEDFEERRRQIMQDARADAGLADELEEDH